ncbi:DUF4175 domain-containing protein [Stenotrophomonas sp. SRS1]|uniref:DUF4175 domain-containing protein n=1 Tax=Stenotrophomonas sp. SRS1 TaxID=2870345 RepID=UPI002237CDDD|nr:DUF4175 domain-containing protein [Stenotrophomonas sp. SRS1]MCW6029491.1 DUF4175 domain-containing protein [Stenotrophomonas sp. SRS1]
MSPTLQRGWQRARRRQWWITTALAVPLAFALSAVAWRIAGFNAFTVVLLMALLISVGLATWRARRLDRQWLIRRLDEHPVAQDSADLLFAAPQALNPLQQRQRAHVDAALQSRLPELRPHWPGRWVLASALMSVVVMALAFGWPRGQNAAPLFPGIAAPPATPAQPPQLRSTRLEITAPAYTGQAARVQNALDGKVAQDSRLRWSLRFTAQPQTAALQFHDGQRIALQRDGDQWSAQWTATRPALYRVVTEPTLRDTRLYRLDVVPDRPPVVRVIAPDRSLVLGAPGQRQWPLQFEATDDYGVVATAQLKVTLAQGSGENITFREQTFSLAGTGPATQRRFARTLDLAALGATEGNDVIAQLTVRDTHTPTAQSAQSSSVILRLPSAAEIQGTDMEGMVKKTLPAYFRSQRQIIIDAEALIKLRGKLPAEEFVKRADAIGVDQRILRLRYGQFLGEESEGGAKPPPTSDTLPTSDVPASTHDDHDHDGEPAQAQAGHDDHDHGAPTDGTAAVFGSATDVLSEYGHTHDHAEAATLLDPKTRATLKAALDQMWSSEGELRQGQPERALPYAYKALGFIKEVQQAERIYLARVGPELPPIDESRRMTGDRAELASRTLPLRALDAPDQAIVEVWQQLADPASAPDLDALTQWLRRNEARLPDPLSLAAAIEELRIAPDCTDCHQALRAQLWRALLRPLPQVPRRIAPDAMGQRYLDALEATP